MRRLISWLSRLTVLRTIVRTLRLHHLANAWLQRFPMIKRLPDSGIVYRATRLESIPLAVEMFEKGSLYDASVLPFGFTTFADLGCNVGYFTCWLAHVARGRQLKGIMLDANPEAVKEAQWHAHVNGLKEVFGLHGIVGEEGRDGMVDFFLYESNICSTSQMPDTEAMGLTGKWTKISVPCLNLEQLWRRHFGDSRCDLLKLDIEGSELNFLKAEQEFLRRIDTIVLEWHKWRVPLDEVRKHLEAHNFVFIKVLEENDSLGTCIFKSADSPKEQPGTEASRLSCKPKTP